MAHFAQLDSNNIVLQVVVVRDQDMLDNDGNQKEEIGISYLQKLFGGNWKQTSYNTLENVRLDPVTREPNGGVPFRGNYAGIGMIYDSVNDVFYTKQPYPSWTISAETNWAWKAPVSRPTIDELTQRCVWNEDTKNWDVVTRPWPQNNTANT